MTVVTSVSGCPRCRSAVTIVSTWPTLVTYWNCGSCGAAAVGLPPHTDQQGQE